MLRAEKKHAKCERCGKDADGGVIWGHRLCNDCCSRWYAEAPATLLNREPPGYWEMPLEERVEINCRAWREWTAKWMQQPKRGAA